MAEYYMTYKEISDVLDNCIGEEGTNVNVRKYKAEVLAAITGNYERNDLESVDQMVELWQNQIKTPSQLLLGDRYVRVQSMMLDFLVTACTSGLIDEIIAAVETQSLPGFSVSVASCVMIGVWELFTSVKKLDNWDFCVYMQAVTHYRTHKKFAKNDLMEWFPSGENGTCNMHNDKWDCDYLENDDTCRMLTDQKLEKALESLEDKKLLKKEKKEGVYLFQFAR